MDDVRPGDPPADLTSRPLTPADATAVFETMAAQELHDLGVVEIEEADIVGDWQRPSFDVAASTVGVFDGDTMVGYAEFAAPDRGDAAVLPSHRGRGVGTWLAARMRDLARSRGTTVVGMPVPEGSPGDRLLAALGYHVRWESWVLKLPRGATITERPLPEGYAVRAAEPADYPDVHTVVEDAFLEWSVRDRETYEDFAATTTERPGFAPWHLRVVTDGAGTVVAAAVVVVHDGDEGREAFISRLATRRDQRGRGLAQALMVDTFAVAREHGAEVCGLSTDSRTGALGLYEKVGMRVTSTWVNRAVDLTPSTSTPGDMA
ncbi:GNAT family N-acetyltransferase [Nocardioides sp.]|uniref:GNAT family N-acetyltransferase n=1 Tax=Nocardioides sp. TaxID=35761 RepID=UPI002726B898|nr:GNAT family N-acetyltransferase [Nocardioides sp.]MDO9456225.1 GNAT family N-acetyltransferase [Nocardioides sp.]